MANPIVALIYDFDKTLSPGDMQEYGFMPLIKSNPDEFWALCADFKRSHSSDGILAYMYMMINKAKELELTRESLRSMGNDVEFYPGVEGWFERVNAIGEQCGVQVEHYIISSGVQEIIEGSAIGDRFKAIFAASFCYDENGRPMWPATAVNYTSKTQYLFRINKGILDVTNDSDLNAYTPHHKRRIPFSNMVYIGDGLTDVPCMKMTRQRGGYSIAVHAPGKTDISDDMLLQDRADFAVLADYSAGSELEQIAGELFRRIRATHELNERHERQLRMAAERKGAVVPESGMRGGLTEDRALEEIE
ncbi:MAG: haloacid dehalogenase-like hydrolase [Clostridia bacterium]|nr:haloacid dehalogenase-like hydrolase [Clostridia bacterium]